MFAKCRVCGAFTLSRTEACPKCGAPFSAKSIGTEALNPNPDLPSRKNASLADRLKLDAEKTRHNTGLEGTFKSYLSWEHLLEDRPHDVPFYTAPHGVATIAVLLGRSSVPHPAVLQDILSERRLFQLHSKAFLDAGYPVLRMNLCIPDNPADPLWLESPLDVSDGDAQDFFLAVQRYEQVNLVLVHEDAISDVVTLIAQPSGLAALLRQEIGKALRRPLDGGQTAFHRAVNRMEQVFARASDGIDRNHLLGLEVHVYVDLEKVARRIIQIMAPYFETTGTLTSAMEEEVKEIGWELHRGGGMDAMRQAYETVDREVRSRHLQSARLLEAFWGGVGDWRG